MDGVAQSSRQGGILDSGFWSDPFGLFEPFGGSLQNPECLGESKEWAPKEGEAGEVGAGEGSLQNAARQQGPFS